MNAFVTTAATPFIHILDWHDFTRDIRFEGDYVYFYFAPSDGKPAVADYRRISYNFVFLLALILAVPDVRPKLRMKILVIGLIIVFPIQVFRLVVFILNYYGQHIRSGEQTAYPLLYRKALNYSFKFMLYLDGYLTPVVIWAGLFFYYKWKRSFFKKHRPA